MESLLLRGQAPTTEDALTASLADLLEDLGDNELLAKVLSCLRPVQADGKPSAPSGAAPADFDAFEIALWPNWGKWGVPDFQLKLLRNDAVVAALAVEVKYEASKSGNDDPEDPLLKDQLGRYAAALRERFPVVKHVLVAYLTADSFPPTEELERSWSSIKKKTKIDPGEVLRWFSWRDVDRVLKEHTSSLSDAIAWRRVDRVRRLLDYAGLRCFAGWPLDIGPALPPAPPSWLGWRIDLFPAALPPLGAP